MWLAYSALVIYLFTVIIIIINFRTGNGITVHSPPGNIAGVNDQVNRCEFSSWCDVFLHCSDQCALYDARVRAIDKWELYTILHIR